MSLFDEAYWEERYLTAAAVWSGEPNRQLVAEYLELPPGTALDAGSGEGGTRSGWPAGAGGSPRSTSRGARWTGARGPRRPRVWPTGSTGCTRPRSWTPPERYDLVSAQFFHLSPPERGEVFAEPGRGGSRPVGGCCWSDTT